MARGSRAVRQGRGARRRGSAAEPGRSAHPHRRLTPIGDGAPAQLGFDLGGDAHAPPPRIEPIRIGEGRLAIGTCGFAYADWAGTFYPRGLPAGERLAFYAERFAVVEIDASYYAVPSRATFAGMAERTPDDFGFSVKAPGTLTHLSLEATLHADAALFRANLAPLREAAKLRCVLFQFPNAFHPSPAALAYLGRLREAFDGDPFAVEFRHREWQTSAILERLAELDVAWTNVDEPAFATLLRPSSDVTSALGYIRFHGRNAAQWWNPPHRDDRYDHVYTDDELAPWVARVRDVAAATRVSYAFFNNHRNGRAVRSATRFAEMLRGRP